jgi:hypothetical protein
MVKERLLRRDKLSIKWLKLIKLLLIFLVNF